MKDRQKCPCCHYHRSMETPFVPCSGGCETWVCRQCAVHIGQTFDQKRNRLVLEWVCKTCHFGPT